MATGPRALLGSLLVGLLESYGMKSLLALGLLRVKFDVVGGEEDENKMDAIREDVRKVAPPLIYAALGALTRRERPPISQASIKTKAKKMGKGWKTERKEKRRRPDRLPPTPE